MCRSPRKRRREAFEAAEKAIEKTAAPLKQQLAALEAPYRAALKSREA